MAIVVINSLLVSTRAFAETRTNRALLHGGFDVMERVTREVREADSVVVLESTLGTHPGVLALSGTDADDDPREVRFQIEGGSVVIYENDVLLGELSGADVAITNLVFRNVTVTGAEAVRVELTVQDLRGVAGKTASFYETIILRGSL